MLSAQLIPGVMYEIYRLSPQRETYSPAAVDSHLAAGCNSS
jgi:hypothetical protein